MKEEVSVRMDMRIYKYFVDMVEEWDTENTVKTEDNNFCDFKKMYISALNNFIDVEYSTNFEIKHIGIVKGVSNKIINEKGGDFKDYFSVVDRVRLPLMASRTLKDKISDSIKDIMNLIVGLMKEYKISYIVDFMEIESYKFKDREISSREMFELVEDMAELAGRGMELYLYLDELEGDCFKVLDLLTDSLK